MSGACIRHTEIPASSALFTDFLYQFERVAGFYPHRPSLSSAPAAIEQLSFDASHREALVAALAEQNSAAGPAAAAHLDRLRDPKTVAVVTGQQVGLYGGPIFSVYKALTAARLAEHLTSQGIPAVPVFWLATEDHDLAEVNHAWVFDDSHEPVRLEAATDGVANQPVGGIVVSDNAAGPLQASLAGLPFADEALRIAQESYAPPVTLQEGFSRLFRRLLGQYGLLHLDPMQPAIRRLAAPLLHRALEKSPELLDRLMERSRQLTAAGYHAQVHVAEDSSLLLLMEEGRRIALKRSGDAYRGEGKTYSSRELLARLSERPQDLSPNALLRPVVQDYLLPTAVYVGGPAELAYLAQAETVYSTLLGRMPVVVPRASMSLVDTKSQKLLSRYRLTLPDCFGSADSLRTKIAERLVPPEIGKALSEGSAQLERSLAAVESKLERFDPTLARALDASRHKIRYQYQKVRAKAAQESLRRDARAAAQASYLSHSLYPHGTLQERAYCALPFLAAHGLGVLDRVYEAINPDCHDHQALAIEF